MERLPYKQEVDARFIRPIRHTRNKSLDEFSCFMEIDPATISKLENRQLRFTPYYEEKLRLAMKRLRITGVEIQSIRKLIDVKESRNYRT
ncbi:hypothetical protein SINU_12160 [Sporolactobacillus inulinus CASD]|uniref:HTH cro/C1-type domain-containing protein n=2 Tax=Sporolactobacillus TaxID=2077 RepID=A0A0U1QLJ9_9BACL|nr:hypothetical protein SINU_12160 [Sporolactobacillus inulinus CASD]MBM7657827.1 transcriptional regulator with XRE-family HTH domain [Sporolactobacillus spathodeae]GEB76174.1 hypothetical protein SIN01_05190 [Sporolactobacillus inulinus]